MAKHKDKFAVERETSLFLEEMDAQIGTEKIAPSEEDLLALVTAYFAKSEPGFNETLSERIVHNPGRNYSCIEGMSWLTCVAFMVINLLVSTVTVLFRSFWKSEMRNGVTNVAL